MAELKIKEIINRLTEMNLPDLITINQEVPIFSRNKENQKKGPITFCLPLSYHGRRFVI